jgi:hypothetical protein
MKEACPSAKEQACPTEGNTRALIESEAILESEEILAAPPPSSLAVGLSSFFFDEISKINPKVKQGKSWVKEFEAMLKRVTATIHGQPNRVRSTMNSFVIACGTNLVSLTDLALQCAREIGPVEVFMGSTACKVVFAPDRIAEAVSKGIVGKKRKTAKC